MKDNKKKRIAKQITATVIFLLLLAMSFRYMNLLFRPKWIFRETSPSSVTSWNDEFQQLEKNSVDALFIGSSHNYFTINPLEIWEESGISSFALGAPSLHADMAAEILEKALKTQSPKVVFLEAYSLTYDESQTTSYSHYTYDSWPLSLEKICSVYRTVEKGKKEMLFPFILYHTRWDEISELDFQYANGEVSAKSLRGYRATYKINQEEIKPLSSKEAALKDGFMPETLQALEKIQALCEENGIRFILWAAPGGEVWNSSYSSQIGQYAQMNGIEFIDFNDPELMNICEIDTSTDFSDTNHLNIYGSTKICNYLTRYMEEELGISGRELTDVEREYWQEYEQFYQAALKEKYLEEIQTGTEYLQFIFSNDYTIFIVNNASISHFRDDAYQYFADIGIPYSSEEPYVAIYDEGKLKEAEILDKEKPIKYQVGEKDVIVQIYPDAKDEGKYYSSLKIDGEELLPSETGIGIVVYDNVLQSVVSSKVVQINEKDKDIILGIE